MPDMGIRINVDSSQVITAQQRLEKLAAMKKASGLDIDIPVSVANSITRTKGGTGIDTAAEKAARSAGTFRREMENSRKVVSDIAKDYEKLIKLGAGIKGFKTDNSGGPSASVSRAESDRMRRESAREAAAFWQSLKDKTTPPKETAGQAYFRQHGNYGRTVTSQDDTGTTGGTGGRVGSNWGRRALGWGMSAAGVATIAGFIAASISSYRSAIDEEGPLFARGIRGSRGRAGLAAGIGISPGEYYGLEDALSKTGLNEKTGIARSAMLSATFAKAHGVDVSDVAGFRKNIYGATGNAGSLPDSLLTQIGKGLDKSRMFELMQRVSQNTHISATAMHGAGLSNSQTAGAAALAEMAFKTGGNIGTYAKSQDFAAVMQNGMHGAGNPAGDIMLFKAMGGFDGPMDFAKRHRMNLMKQEGFLSHPGVLKKIIAQIGGGDLDSRAGKMESFFKGWGIDGKASELMLRMNDTGFLDNLSKRKGSMMNNIKDMAKTDPEAAKWLKEIQANPALARQAVESSKEMLKIEAGEKLSKLFEPIETSAVKFAGALADGKWQEAFKNLDGTGKLLLTGAGLMAAGGAMSMIGGIAGLGKGGAGLLGPMMGPGGLLALAGLGGLGAYATFKDGGNFQPQDRMTAITGKGRSDKYSSQWIPYKDDFDKAAKEYGIDVNLLYGIARTESGFRTNAISRKGATGLMQLMPGTAKGLGVDSTIPGENIKGGTKYFSSLLKKYGGDRDKALAAYNWGPGNVDKYGMSNLPAETENYIKSVKGSQQGYFESSQPETVAQDSTLQMLAGILQTIAQNTAKPITAQPLPIGAK
jgi:hypothetical protein